MNKGFGLAAILLSVVAIFIPLIGAYMTLIVALLAVVAARGSLAWSVAAIVTDMVNILFLSPTLWATDGALALMGNSSFGGILLWIHVAALVAVGVIAFRQRPPAVPHGAGADGPHRGPPDS